MTKPVTRTLLLSALVLAAWSNSVGRADADVGVSVKATPNQVRVGESFRLQVQVDADGGDIDGLELEDLRKYPALEILSHQTSRPMQVSFGFGSGMKVESSLSRLYVIRALAAGTYEFSPAEAKVDGKVYRSDPLTIVVLEDDAVGQALALPTASTADELSGGTYDPRAFLRTVVSDTEVYLGQQIDITVYLYARLRVAGQSVNPTKPDMDGFWVYDQPVTTLEGSIVEVNGAQYRAYVLQRSAIFPQRTGELTIGAPKVAFDVATMSLFDAPEQVERVGVPVSIDVKPLPQPGPADATVGKYSMRAWLDRKTVETGNAVTLRVDVSGVGNIQDLRLTLPPIAGVRALQPAIRDNVQLQRQVLSGTRSWEWILIPETPGSHTIPSLAINYFDPGQGQYGTARSEPMPFRSTGNAVPPPATIEPVDPVPPAPSATFGPLRMYSALERQELPVRERPWFRPALAVPPLLMALAALGLIFTRRRREQSATREAVRGALLSDARSALRGDDPRVFYDKIVAVITQSIDDKLDEATGGLSNAAMRQKLSTAGFDDDLVQRVSDELEGADYARFAASGVDRDEMQRCLDRTQTILKRIERVRGTS